MILCNKKKRTTKKHQFCNLLKFSLASCFFLVPEDFVFNSGQDAISAVMLFCLSFMQNFVQRRDLSYVNKGDREPYPEIFDYLHIPYQSKLENNLYANSKRKETFIIY